MDITMTANRITLTAKESVTINGGGSYTVWNVGAIKSGTTGSHVAHAGDHGHQGAKSVPVVMPFKPQAVCIECMKKAAKQGAIAALR
jgi:type VI secretion system secreted protein VgrG